MVIRETFKEIRKNMRGGDGEVTIISWIDGSAKPKNVRLAGVLELPPGASIGMHKHEGEAEIFHVISGKGEYSDNGEIVEVAAGYTTLCPDGSEHGIKNTGSEPLIVNAFIVQG